MSQVLTLDSLSSLEGVVAFRAFVADTGITFCDFYYDYFVANAHVSSALIRLGTGRTPARQLAGLLVLDPEIRDR